MAMIMLAQGQTEFGSYYDIGYWAGAGVNVGHQGTISML